MVEAVEIQMNAREKLREELRSWLHLQWWVGEGKRVSKVQSDHELEFGLGRLLKPLVETEVRQGSCSVGMEEL